MRLYQAFPWKSFLRVWVTINIQLQRVLVQLAIAHPRSLTSFSLQEYLIYDFNGSLFHPIVNFLIIHTHRLMVSSLFSYGISFHIPPSMTHKSSNIYNLFIYHPSNQVPFFSICATITNVTTHHTYRLHFPSIYGIRMPSQHLKPTHIHSNITTIRKYRYFVEILKYVFSYFFSKQSHMLTLWLLYHKS